VRPDGDTAVAYTGVNDETSNAVAEAIVGSPTFSSYSDLVRVIVSNPNASVALIDSIVQRQLYDSVMSGTPFSPDTTIDTVCTRPDTCEIITCIDNSCDTTSFARDPTDTTATVDTLCNGDTCYVFTCTPDSCDTTSYPDPAHVTDTTVDTSCVDDTCYIFTCVDNSCDTTSYVNPDTTTTPDPLSDSAIVARTAEIKAKLQQLNPAMEPTTSSDWMRFNDTAFVFLDTNFLRGVYTNGDSLIGHDAVYADFGADSAKADSVSTAADNNNWAYYDVPDSVENNPGIGPDSLASRLDDYIRDD
jgi:hypothetical protein